MNRPDSHEELSAWLDDELSPKRRDEVDRLLADSDAAQAEVVDYRQISRLLNALPPVEAPADLVDGVMSRIATVAREPVRPAFGGDRDHAGRRSPLNRNSWLYAAAATLVTAAVVVLTIRFIDANRDDVSREIVRSQADRPAVVEATNATGPNAGVEALEENFARIDQNKLDDSRDTVARSADSTLRESEGETGLVFGDDLKNAEVGRVVRALDRRGDRATVVRLTVVDRRVGLESLQLLLARHRIISDPAGPANRPLGEAVLSRSKSERPSKSTAKKVAAKPAESSGVDDRVVAVWVEATDGELVRALSDISHADLFRKLEVDGPIQIAGLDVGARSTAASDGTETSGAEFAKDAEQARHEHGARPSVNALLDRKRREVALDGNARQTAGGIAKSASRIPDDEPRGRTVRPTPVVAEMEFSRQRTLELPAELLDRPDERHNNGSGRRLGMEQHRSDLRRSAGGFADAAEAKRRAKSSPRSQFRSPDLKPTVEALNDKSSRVRVLFVLVDSGESAAR